MFISACIITKNEEKNIERCINSFKESVSEIIVADTGSTDTTVKIAEKLGAKAYVIKWENDFAKAKNFAISKASGDWIVFLDADEYFDKSTSSNLHNIINKYHNQKDVQSILSKIINIDCENDNSFISEFRSIRIFRKIDGLRYEGNIHEHLLFNGKDVNYVFDKDICIYHTGYSAGINKLKQKRNLEILEYNRSHGNNSFKNEFYLAHTYFILNDYNKAIEHIKNALNNDVEVIGYRIKPFELYFDSMISLNNYSEEFYDYLELAEKKHKNHPLFAYYRAASYYMQKKYAKALEFFEKTLELNNNYKNDDDIIPVEYMLDKIYFYMGNIYEIMNSFDTALKYYIYSLKENKENCESFSRFCILCKGESPHNTVGIINGIYNIKNENELKFLIENLCKYKLGMVLFYYWKIWHDDFSKEDSSYLITLLSVNKYDDAFNLIFESFYESSDKNTKEYSVLYLVLSSLLSGNANNIEKIFNRVDEPYQNIIKAFLGIGNSIVNDSEFLAYSNLLEEIISFTNKETTKLFLQINNSFSTDNKLILAGILCKWNFYDLAVNVYNEILLNDNIAKIHNSIGICHYMLNDFESAYKAFENAIASGYSDNDCFEFLSWIYKKTDNPDYKNKIEEFFRETLI